MIVCLLVPAAGGLVIGAVLAVFLVFGPAEFGGIKVGPWRTNVHIGSPDAPDIVRSIIARRGLLAMSREETVYFSADTDSGGDALDETCLYEVIFREAVATRWWSLTLYAEDDFLAINGSGMHSISVDTARADSAGNLVVTIGGDTGLNPISSENAGAFNLTLRLYNPDPSIVDDPGTAVLPSIDRLGCEGEAA